jgi:hypothetical protein
VEEDVAEDEEVEDTAPGEVDGDAEEEEEEHEGEEAVGGVEEDEFVLERSRYSSVKETLETLAVTKYGSLGGKT